MMNHAIITEASPAGLMYYCTCGWHGRNAAEAIAHAAADKKGRKA